MSRFTRQVAGAIVAAAINGDRIYVAAGTYTGAGSQVVLLTRSIELLGGWAGAAVGAHWSGYDVVDINEESKAIFRRTYDAGLDSFLTMLSDPAHWSARFDAPADRGSCRGRVTGGWNGPLPGQTKWREYAASKLGSPVFEKRRRWRGPLPQRM